MAPITITVTDRSGKVIAEVVGDNDGFKAILEYFDASFLRDENGAKVRSFGGLLCGSSYTLGPPLPKDRATLTTNANTARFEAALKDVQRRLNEVLTRDTVAVSYSNYYEEKVNQSRVRLWHTPPARASGNEQILGKRVLDAQSETGGIETVRSFWKKFMQEDSEQIVPGISNSYEGL